ncbi:MAG: MarR family winged helix-turn-helix transcriptional regulator [Nocardioidaceae bacterium]
MTQELLEAYRLLVADVYELAGASRATSEQLARAEGCTAAQWHVMSVVSEEGLTVATAARRLGLSRQAVQRVANDLRDLGYVRSSTNPGDRRAPLIGLTRRGHGVLTRLWTASHESREQLLSSADLSPEDLLSARVTLRRLLRAYEQTGGHVGPGTAPG